MSATLDTRTIPVITCAGDARTRGLIQGEALRQITRATVGRWSDLLAVRHGLPASDYISEFLAATRFVPAIERWTPELLDEVRGIADGAGLPFETILAYNLMDEEWTYGAARGVEQPGCTVACLTGRHGSPPVVAQTMDIPDVHDGSQVVIHHKPVTGPEMVIFTGAGMIGLNGANEHGVGVVVNNLAMLPSSRSGLPVLFAIRGVLEQSCLGNAAAFIESIPHAIGQHYAIGAPEGIVGLEGAANGVSRIEPPGDRYVHANHPLANDAIEGDPAAIYARSSTFARHDRAEELIADAAGLGDVERALMDETAPISRVPKAGFMTFGATSIVCSAPPTVRVTAGPPHLNSFQDVGFSA